MARKLPFLYRGSLVEIEADSTIHREDLYGKATRRIEKDGQPLLRGILAPDGTLFPAGDFKLVRPVDHDGSMSAEVETRTQDGKQAAIHTASGKEARELTPITSPGFPELTVDSVIPVTIPATLPEGFYSTGYTFRDSATLQDAVLVVKGDGTGFLLAGVKKDSPFLEKGTSYNFFDEETAQEEEASEDVSFTMF